MARYFHGWNNQVQMLSDYAGLKPWSLACIEAFRKLELYVPTVPPTKGGPAGFANGTSEDHGNVGDQPTPGMLMKWDTLWETLSEH